MSELFNVAGGLSGHKEPKVNYMALPFLSSSTKRRDQIVAIDLGGRTTKAAQLQRSGDTLILSRFAVVDAPVFEKAPSTDLLTEHLKVVAQALDTKTKQAVIALGVSDSIVRQTEFPLMPVSAMREILSTNTKTYLQQDYPGYVFDCHILPQRHAPGQAEKSKGPAAIPRASVLAAGAKRQFVGDLQNASKAAGFSPEYVIPGLVGPANAFERAMPDAFARDAVALVDIGFRNSTICILLQGQMLLTRVVSIGGDRLTQGLAEQLGTSYAEAEGIKIGMPSEVLAQLESLVSPLGRELRASIDFFEHQQDKAVSKVFVSGASARSELIVNILQQELMVDCSPWNPTASLFLALTPQQTVELENTAPQLTVAIGAACATF